jgi:hypothetical protein
MSLKASWVRRLVSNQLINWEVIPCKYFAKLGKKWLVFSQNLDNITYINQITIYPIIKQKSFVIKLDKFVSPYNLFSDVCNPYRISILKNKFFYELLLNEKFTKPIGFNTWNTYLQKELPKCETVCYFTFSY